MQSFVRSYWLVIIDFMFAMTFIIVVGYAATETISTGGAFEPVWVLLTAAMLIAGPAATRRLAPLASLVVSLVASFAAMASGVIQIVAMGAPMSVIAFVLYVVALDLPVRRSALALAACVAVSVALMLAHQLAGARAGSWADSAFGIGFVSLMLVTAWVFGWAARGRRRNAAESAAREMEQAVAEERMRIARELHDIVAHSMSVIAVKAGIANHVAEQRPDEAREALRVIEATSRGSLNEMRQLLTALRSEVDGPDLAPVPGPAGIPALVDRARSAGVAADLSLDDTAELSEGIGLSVYRIVQEALTNVVRHAAPARCVVTVGVDDDAVRVGVVNDGPRVITGAGGHGLIGMRERVSVYGGTFAAGPRRNGGWEVSAVLPR